MSGPQIGASSWGQSLTPELRETRGSEMVLPLQGGSFGRGTDLRGGCDAELVIFFNCFNDYKDQSTCRPQILSEMRAQLESGWQDPVPGLSLQFPEQTVPGALQFHLVSTALESWMDVTMLPVFDAVGEGCLQLVPWKLIPLPAMLHSLSGVKIPHFAELLGALVKITKKHPACIWCLKKESRLLFCCTLCIVDCSAM